jgi:hypothetical protein
MRVIEGHLGGRQLACEPGEPVSEITPGLSDVREFKDTGRAYPVETWHGWNRTERARLQRNPRRPRKGIPVGSVWKEHG